MLKVRVMPTLLYKSHMLVKGVGFDSWRGIGGLMQAIKVYNMREVDELVFLDIAATREGREPDYSLIDEFADECFVPLTVGGGVRTSAQVERLLKVGADKVAINTAAAENLDVVRTVSAKFGAQCVVVSIDVKRGSDGLARVYTRSGTHDTMRHPVEFAIAAEEAGAGEILLTSVDRDGTMSGYDLDLIQSVTRAVSIPVIASGGAGNYSHMADALKSGADAVAAASIFHFTQQTPREAKLALAQAGFRVRL